MCRVHLLCAAPIPYPVGYQGIDNQQGNTLQVPTFNSIGGEGFKLQDLIPSGDTIIGGGETTLQTLTKDKTQAQLFFWLTDNEWGTSCGKDGWFEGMEDEQTEELSDKVFDPGEGYIFYSQNGTAKTTYSGEVKYPVEIDVVQGNTICGNFWPTKMSIQSIIPAGSTTIGGGETTLQTLTKDKTQAELFFWLTDNEWGTTCGEDGWFEGMEDEQTVELSKREFKPGEAFLFYSQNGAATLNFPELKVGE